ncbi:MAG: hypothetical protein NTX50_11910 [Candidatus Sumerlaeota bacterium]|nr:hypothetical protein [Candidatus Sumerlaeota bacterium]
MKTLCGKSRGLTLIELAVVIVCAVLLFFFIVPSCILNGGDQVRAKVSRAKADQRSLAIALEAYYVDYKAYPAWVCGGNGVCSNDWTTTPGLIGHVNAFAGTGPGAAKIHSFRIRNGSNADNLFMTLTTPISYMTSYFADPFASTRGASYGYYADAKGWIVYSFGPDMDESCPIAGDIDPYVEARLKKPLVSKYGEFVYDGRIAQPTLLLIAHDGRTATGLDFGTDAQAFTYDPTNGTASEGDVYRCKQ